MRELPKPKEWEERKFIKCNVCGTPSFYDFVPYSLSNPIMYLKCGHSLGRKIHECTIEIKESEFYDLIAKFESD